MRYVKHTEHLYFRYNGAAHGIDVFNLPPDDVYSKVIMFIGAESIDEMISFSLIDEKWREDLLLALSST